MENKLNFGKYKGKELVEVAATDPQYINWLKGLPNLPLEIKQQIVNININNGELKKEDSPEHNKLQLRTFNVLNEIKTFINEEYNINPTKIEIEKEEFEFHNIDIFSHYRVHYDKYMVAIFALIIEIKPYLNDDFMSYIRQIEKYKILLKQLHYSEIKGILVYEKFNVSNLTLDEVDSIFNNKDIYLLSIEELEK